MQKNKLNVTEQMILRMKDLNLTMADVARSAGMSPEVFRYHLRNKSFDKEAAKLRNLFYILGLDFKSIM